MSSFNPVPKGEAFFKVEGKTGPKPKKPLKSGKRTAKRRAVVVKMKKLCASIGVASCELKMEPGCLRDWALGFAHSRKSRNIVTDAHWEECALACIKCHERIELLPEQDMGDVIRKVIANRPKSVNR